MIGMVSAYAYASGSGSAPQIAGGGFGPSAVRGVPVQVRVGATWEVLMLHQYPPTRMMLEAAGHNAWDSP
jgi:hypothetical protein